MTAYTPTVWANEEDGGTVFLSAANLNKIEGGVQGAQQRADDAYALASSASGGSIGFVTLDSFAGADDEEKLTAALSYVAAQTQKPAIMMPTGRLVTFTTTRATFDGLKLIGPPVVGWQNIERSSGSLNPVRIRLNCGTGTSSWLVGTGSVYNLAVRDLAFESTNANTQFFHHTVASGTCYAGSFHNLGFQAFKHVLGNPTEPLSMTLCAATGLWNMTTARGRQIDVSGSDNLDMWVSGVLNVGPGGGGTNLGGGESLVSIRTAKSNWGNLYITADDEWRALLLQGNMSFQVGNRLRGFVIEGRNSGDPSSGALVKVTGGGWHMSGFDLNYAMSSPATYTDATDRGYIHQTGGTLHIDEVTVDRAAGVAETTPILFVTGASSEAIISRVVRCTKGGAWTVRPTVQQTAAGKIISNDATVQLVTAA